MWYGGAHLGGFYETLTSLVYFALLATPLYLRPTLVRHERCYQEPACLTVALLLPHALLSPCSLPAALAYLTLSFPDAVYPVLQRIASASPTPLERTLKRRLSAVLPIRYQLGTRRSDSDSSKCARVSVQI